MPDRVGKLSIVGWREGGAAVGGGGGGGRPCDGSGDIGGIAGKPCGTGGTRLILFSEGAVGESSDILSDPIVDERLAWGDWGDVGD